jgi:predicted ArsR family transcriptional regulator
MSLAKMRNDEPAVVDLLPDARRALLSALKHTGWATIPELAYELSISTEAVRQQISFLSQEGWVISNCGPDDGDGGRSPGRPAAKYCLSRRGDDLFPKQYAELAVALFDELRDPARTLATMTNERVDTLRKSMPEHSVRTNIEALRSIYRAGDPYVDVEKSERGHRLIEWNCPYLQFATERPLFCSTTVSVLRRLTGCEVVREERFQDGDGRCVFHIYFDAPLSARRKARMFEPEPPKDAGRESLKHTSG